VHHGAFRPRIHIQSIIAPAFLRVSGGTAAILIAVPVAALLIDLARFPLPRWRDTRRLMSGLKSGALLGAALFVLLAQALSNRTVATEPETILSFLGLGFIVALLLDRGWSIFGPRLSTGGAWVLTAILRSTAGAAIGAVSHTSLEASLLVAAASLLPESLLIRASGASATHRRAQHGLALHPLTRSAMAALPLAALLSITALTPMSPGMLNAILALAAGGGVYVSASMLIPETHHTHSQWPTLSVTVASSMIVYGLVRLT
jgi:hypothetical protein